MVEISKKLLKLNISCLEKYNALLDGVIKEAKEKDTIKGLKLKAIIILRNDNIKILERDKNLLKEF